MTTRKFYQIVREGQVFWNRSFRLRVIRYILNTKLFNLFFIRVLISYQIIVPDNWQKSFLIK